MVRVWVLQYVHEIICAKMIQTMTKILRELVYKSNAPVIESSSNVQVQ